MSRRSRRRDLSESDESDDETDPDEAEDVGTMIPDTSLSDLTQTADPASFDQTFSDDDALLTLQGAFDPTAGPKQVIPRIGFTINFQMVWNAEKERWEPDEGNDGGGLGSPAINTTVTIASGNRVNVATGITDPDPSPDVLLPVVTLAESTPGENVAVQYTETADTALQVPFDLIWDNGQTEWFVNVENNKNNSHTLRVKLFRV